MLRRSFVRLVASCLALSPLIPSASAEEGAQVSDPIIHANLAIYLVHGGATGGAVPMTLEEALAKKRVRVAETGTVNELTVENIGDVEVFVQAGDIVKGGRQDRVLSVDLLLPPRSGKVSVAAFCVESGRWSARGQEDTKEFSTAAAAMPSQEAKAAMHSYAASTPPALPLGFLIERSTRSSGPDTGARQAEIWASVKKTQERLARSVGAPVAAQASPSSLQLSLENEKLRAAQAAYIETLQGAGEASNDVVGYVFAINGKIAGGDVYASNALFRKKWRQPLAANVTEAIGHNDAGAASPPSTDEVKSFLATVQNAPESERTPSGIVRLATRDSDQSLYAETRRADGDWIHRAYLAK